MTGHSLLMPFDCDDPTFARGFEAGRVYDLLWHLIEDDAEPEAWAIHMPITMHASNAEMVLRIAERYGCAVRSQDLDGDWIAVTFEPR